MAHVRIEEWIIKDLTEETKVNDLAVLKLPFMTISRIYFWTPEMPLIKLEEAGISTVDLFLVRILNDEKLWKIILKVDE